MKGISSRLISKGGVLNGLIRYQEYTEWPKQILSLEKKYNSVPRQELQTRKTILTYHY